MSDGEAPIQHSTLNIQHSRFFIVISIVALLAFAKPLLLGEVPTFRDHSDYFQPLRWFTANEMRHGRMPLWNVYSASGERWLANPQTCVFYPPAWLFLALPFPTAYVLFLVLHLILLGCSAWLLFRRYASEMAALAAALALMFCGPVMSLLDINNNLVTFAWLPLVLWCALADVGPQWSALVIALSFLGGEPFFAALGAAAFALIRRRDIINVALTSIAFSAIQLFPFLELVRGSDRAGVARDDLLWESMPLRDWLGVFWPVQLATAQHFIPIVYVGLLACVLAVIAMFAVRRRMVYVCAAVILVCIGVAAGAYFAPTAAFLRHLPLMIFRFPARVVPVAATAVCALAAIGADRAVRPRWLVLVAVVMCVDPLLRTLPLLDSAPFNAHPVPYDRSVGRDAKFVRLGFGREQIAQRRAWIAGYLNLYERRFDAWTAAPMASIEYTEAYEAAMMQQSGAALKAMSVAYIVTKLPDGTLGVLHDTHALPLAYLRGADGRVVASSLLAFTGSAMYVTTDAPFDGTLVVTQQLVPGWRATIDGRDTETFREGVFRAVRVTRGHHEVTWRYRPASLVIGAIVTLLAIARLILSRVLSRVQRTKIFFARPSKLRGLFERCEV
jgi:hypothetical protein